MPSMYWNKEELKTVQDVTRDLDRIVYEIQSNSPRGKYTGCNNYKELSQRLYRLSIELRIASEELAEVDNDPREKDYDEL